MRYILSFILIGFSSLACAIEEVHLYDYIAAKDYIKTVFTVERKEGSVKFRSQEMYQVDETRKINKVQITLVGPYQFDYELGLADAANHLINDIKSRYELNLKYLPTNKIAEGIGAVTLKVNGLDVIYLDYQIEPLNNAMVKRAVILKQKKLYDFTLTDFSPNVGSRDAIVLDVIVIDAVNSGKL